MKDREVIFGEYTVTFNHKKNKCSIKRLDGERIDTSSEKFVKDFREIRKTEEYERNFKLMNLNYERKYSPNRKQSTIGRIFSDIFGE